MVERVLGDGATCCGRKDCDLDCDPSEKKAAKKAVAEVSAGPKEDK